MDFYSYTLLDLIVNILQYRAHNKIWCHVGSFLPDLVLLIFNVM